MLLPVSALLLSCAAAAQTAPGTSEKPIVVAETQQGGTVPERDRFVDELNANTVTIVSGNPNGAYLYFAYDMSAVLDDGDKLRILPVIGKGGGQNTKDILYLRGVDMGITQSNILRYYNKTGEVGRNIQNRLRYITRLYNEEMHLLVAPNINSVEDLRGKKVNFSDIGSGTQVSSQLIFEALKIKVQEVNMGQADAFEAIKKGDIAATILIAGKPTGAFGKLKSGPEYKLLPMPYPPALQDDYLPATLTHEDYPGLIPEGQTVDTVAVGAVLAVFNWPANTERYRRVAKFTEALFKNFDKFLEKPRHPKWKEVNLAADLPGWERFGAAKELLVSNTRDQAAGGQDRLKADFARFLTNSAPQETAATMTDQRREDLFKKFLQWQSTQR
jgi:uncharacterized protein